MTYADLITGALTEIRVARAGDVVAPEIMALGLNLAIELLDQWNAVPDLRASYAEVFTDYVLTPNLSPHTIGPTGTFVVAQRPVSLEMAQVSLGGSPPVFIPITVRSKRWYANQPVPLLNSTFPTDVYYEPDWPNGKLLFWPVSTTNYGVRLWTRTLLVTPALTVTPFSLPPGYMAAARLTLAEKLARPMGQSIPASLAADARHARAIIFETNEDTPALSTADSGLGSSAPTAFNWLNRSSR
jgi:hypothetical protein